MCMTHGERRLISSQCQKKYLESKKKDKDQESIQIYLTDGQHSDYSAYMQVVHNVVTRSLLNTVFIDKLFIFFSLNRLCHFFIFLWFTFSQQHCQLGN